MLASCKLLKISLKGKEDIPLAKPQLKTNGLLKWPNCLVLQQMWSNGGEY